jgi:hypothetical protein
MNGLEDSLVPLLAAHSHRWFADRSTGFYIGPKIHYDRHPSASRFNSSTDP